MPTFILAADETPKPQSKTFNWGGPETINQKAPKQSMFWLYKNVEISNVHDLKKQIDRHITKNNQWAILRGKLRSPEEIEKLENDRKTAVAERAQSLSADLLKPFLKKGEKYTQYVRRNDVLVDAPLNWVCFDFDGVEIESLGPFDVTNPLPHINHLIQNELGNEFVGVDYLLQFSSSAGLKPGVSAHVWFFLDVAVDGAFWRSWYKRRCAEVGRKIAIDKGLFEVARIHYIAPPIFLDDRLIDPVEDAFASRYQIVEGFADKVIIENIEEINSIAQVTRDKIAAKISFLDTDDEEERADAYNRAGIVGAFNRTYSISQVITEFLYDHFTIVTEDGRVTWNGHTPEGCKIIAANTKLMSTHATDPREGQLANAFDLIETYLFDGDYGQTAAWAESLPLVKEELERAELAAFDEIEIPSVHFEPEIKVPEPVAEGEKLKPKKEILTSEKLRLLYPMPERIAGKDTDYRLTSNGFFFGVIEEEPEDEDEGKKKKKGKKKSGGFVPLWSPICMHSSDTCVATKNMIITFKMMDDNGEPLLVPVYRKDFEPRALLSALREKGWKASSQNGLVFADFASTHSAQEKHASLPQRGWNTYFDETGDKLWAFAGLDGEVIGDKWPIEGKLVVAPQHIVKPSVAKAGSLENWQETIRTICEVDNVPHWVIGAVGGLVGPLVEITGSPTSGMSLCGVTSRGKTTALTAATSAWTTPQAKDGGLFYSFAATSSSNDITAATANGTVLILDETNAAEGRTLEQLLYQIASGAGKRRAKMTGDALRHTNSWSTFVMLSGETGVAEKFEGATGRKMGKGAAVRFLDLDVSGFNANVPKAVVDRIQRGFRDNYGWAGPEFVRKLVEKGWLGRLNELRARKDYFVNKFTGGLTGIPARGAEVIAMLALAGELALDFGILPREMEGKLEAALQEAWNQFTRGAVADIEGSVIENIRAWIASRWDRSIVELGVSGNFSRDVEGWYDASVIYLPPDSLTEAAGGVMREKEILRILGVKNLVEKRSDDSGYRISRIPKIGSLTHFRLTRLGDNGFMSKTEDGIERDFGNEEDMF